MEKSFGGVIINEAGLVLLREPSNHYGGYVWTFAKGRAKPGESPKQAALREVLEETGIVAQMVAKLPGVFSGYLTETAFFLMRPVKNTGTLCWETKRVRWVREQKARQLIALTTNSLGRARDLQALSAAFEVFTKPAFIPVTRGSDGQLETY